MRQLGEHIWGRITAVIICLVIAVVAGILIWAGVKSNRVSLENFVATPVLYQEKSVPVESSGAIPDTDSNDEGMQDLEKEPTVINL
ncbi:MAG: hypothetical protein K2H41_14580 [Acetatifactor sp.]|nr:hypothetical protein [Acetatifactor sp.]